MIFILFFILSFIFSIIFAQEFNNFDATLLKNQYQESINSLKLTTESYSLIKEFLQDDLYSSIYPNSTSTNYAINSSLSAPITKYQCKPENNNPTIQLPKFYGTNLGGWMVLEPWITPSLFFQFLGKTKIEEVGLDSKTFCSALGPVEANRQLRSHWKSWFTRQILLKLKRNDVKYLRLPLPDWLFKSYPPYDSGCWNGGIEVIEEFLRWCDEEGIKVVIDVHAAIGSQVSSFITLYLNI